MSTNILQSLLQANKLKEFYDTRVVSDPNFDRMGLAGGVDYNTPENHILRMAPSAQDNSWVLAHELGHLASQQKYKDYLSPRDNRPLNMDDPSSGKYFAEMLEREADMKALRYLFNANMPIDDNISMAPGRELLPQDTRQEWLRKQGENMGYRPSKNPEKNSNYLKNLMNKKTENI